VVVNILLLIRRKAATLLKVGEVACKNYFSIKILIRSSRLWIFLLSLPCLLKRIDLILYLVIKIIILYLSICQWKNGRNKTYKTVIFTVVVHLLDVMTWWYSTINRDCSKLGSLEMYVKLEELEQRVVNENLVPALVVLIAVHCFKNVTFFS